MVQRTRGLNKSWTIRTSTGPGPGPGTKILFAIMLLERLEWTVPFMTEWMPLRFLLVNSALLIKVISSKFEPIETEIDKRLTVFV